MTVKLQGTRYDSLSGIKFDAEMNLNVIEEIMQGKELAFLEAIRDGAPFRIDSVTDAKTKGLEPIYSIKTWSRLGIAKHLGEESNDVEMTGKFAAYISVDTLRPAGAELLDSDYATGKIKFSNHVQNLSDACKKAFKIAAYETIERFPTQRGTAIVKMSDPVATFDSIAKVLDAFIEQDYVTATKVTVSTKFQRRLARMRYVEITNVSVWDQLLTSYSGLTFEIKQDLNKFDYFVVFDDSEVTTSLELPFEIKLSGKSGLSDMYIGRFATVGTLIKVPENFLLVDIQGI